ncbi:MAG: cytochrome c oxidase subunit II [Candidatus Cohnella colombiensis]|uniref:Cytochrome aa3 subunit 2 n=1 Tax=Candidatus Cohnella colombiensis TaxID=3121368 RepID=A0AA95EXC9_9BACL|nr:MAG: cytochrome c oxidase subunit II [Cohnella sp.]
MKMHRTEKVWLTASFGMIMMFMLLTGYQVFAKDMGMPSNKETIDWKKVSETAPFDKPGVYQIGDKEYEVVMTLEIFAFDPFDIEVPAGSTVHFTLTSKDVVHGFEIAETNTNAMVPPGYIQKVKQKFDKPGQYLILCNEYCGAGHQGMYTTIKVV